VVELTNNQNGSIIKVANPNVKIKGPGSMPLIALILSADIAKAKLAVAADKTRIKALPNICAQIRLNTCYSSLMTSTPAITPTYIDSDWCLISSPICRNNTENAKRYIHWESVSCENLMRILLRTEGIIFVGRLSQSIQKNALRLILALPRGYLIAETDRLTSDFAILID
jgi:hypothetical protein